MRSSRSGGFSACPVKITREMNDQSTPGSEEIEELPDTLLTGEMTRRKFIKRMAWTGAGVLGAGGMLYWSTKIEPSWIDIVRVPLKIAGLHPAFVGMRLAQISDIHVSEWMTRQRLQYVVHRVNQLQPDWIAITGDFVSRRQTGHDRILTEVLSTLKPRRDAFAVMGNHDHWSNVKFIRNAVAKSGVQELDNSFHTIHKDGGVLHICGLDDAWARAADMSQLLRKLPEKGAAILLAHEPDFADDYVKANRFDAQLAGHSHGGQVRVPLIGPIHLPKHGQKYHNGSYHISAGQRKMELYVNRGAGMVAPYVRLNCRPEITLFTLTGAIDS